MRKEGKKKNSNQQPEKILVEKKKGEAEGEQERHSLVGDTESF